MTDIPPTNISKNVKACLIGGSLVLATGVALRFLWRQWKRMNQNKILTEEKMIEILRDMRRARYPLIYQVSKEAHRIQKGVLDELGYLPKGMDNMLIHKFFGDGAEMGEEVNKIDLAILQRYGLTDLQLFQEACVAWEKKSPRVLGILLEMGLGLKRAALADYPFPKIEPPSPEIRTLVIRQFLRRYQKLTKQFLQLNFEHRKSSGFQDFSSPEYQQRLDSIINMVDPELVGEYPAELARDYPEDVLYYAYMEHLRNSDPQFAANFSAVLEKMNSVSRQIHDPSRDYDLENLMQQVDTWTFGPEPAELLPSAE